MTQGSPKRTTWEWKVRGRRLHRRSTKSTRSIQLKGDLVVHGREPRNRFKCVNCVNFPGVEEI